MQCNSKRNLCEELVFQILSLYDEKLLEDATDFRCIRVYVFRREMKSCEDSFDSRELMDINIEYIVKRLEICFR